MSTCNHLVSRKAGDLFISYFAHAAECPHCLAQQVIDLQKRIKELETACKAVAHALANNDLAGVIVWVLPPFQIRGVHETAWERLQSVLVPDPYIVSTAIERGPEAISGVIALGRSPDP